MAKKHLFWHRPYSTVSAGGFIEGDCQWFPEGGLNVSYNCVDRWAYKHPDKVRMTSEIAVSLDLTADGHRASRLPSSGRQMSLATTKS